MLSWTHLSYLPCLSRTVSWHGWLVCLVGFLFVCFCFVLFVFCCFLLDVNEGEEGVVAVHLPIRPLKTYLQELS